MSSYGYMSMYKPPKPPKLAQAAAAKDPYGLVAAGSPRIGAGSGFAVNAEGAVNPNDPKVAAALHQANPSGSSFFSAVPVPAAPTPTAAAVNQYDLNTDPALQSVKSMVGESNDQANASALKQRQDLVLAYGDPTIASAVLGASDPIAQAAGQNPTGTVQQLGQSRDRNLKTLDDQLNAANLGYSGYRITQEQQAGTDYQNALAQAAAGLNSNLDTVGSNLAAQLAGNNAQVVQATSDAAARAAAAAASSGTDPGAVAAGGALPGGGAITAADLGFTPLPTVYNPDLSINASGIHPPAQPSLNLHAQPGPITGNTGALAQAAAGKKALKKLGIL